jgi:Ca2+-binding RTX toxin-like protein
MLRRLAVATSVTWAIGLVSAAAAPALIGTEVGYTQDGALDITGDSQSNLLTVSLSGSNIIVREAGMDGVFAFQAGCMNTDPKTVQCAQDPPDLPSPAPPSAPIATLSVFLGDGNDSFTNLTPFGTPVVESPQNDLAIDGGNGNDVIHGGSAPETIIAGFGKDLVDGGGGDDTLINSSASFQQLLDGDGGLFRDQALARDEADGTGDTYVGGAGDDVTRFDARQDNLNITLDGAANDGAPNEGDNVQTESVVGGSGSDVITGDGGANTLAGGPGADILSGLGGADLLEGGRDNDSLVGGRARDQLRCDSGFDLAVSRPIDAVSKDCERTGADLGSDTGRVRHNATRVWIACPSQEGAKCRGQVTLKLDGRKLGAARFKVRRGKVKAFGFALNRRGRVVMQRRRSILVSANIRTAEPLGQALQRKQLLLTR